MPRCGSAASLAIALLSIGTQSPVPAFQGASAPRSSGALSVEAAVYLYGRGEFDAAVQRLNTHGLLVRQFTRDLDAWIADAVPSDVTRRRRVAAAFAIDAAGTPPDPLQHYEDEPRSVGHVLPSDIEKWKDSRIHGHSRSLRCGLLDSCRQRPSRMPSIGRSAWLRRGSPRMATPGTGSNRPLFPRPKGAG